MAISHAFSNAIPDGTNTNIVRPSDWNSAHNQYYTLSGNTLGASTVSGTNIVLQGSGNVSLSGTGQTVVVYATGGGVGGGVAIGAGAQTATSGTVVLSNSNGISFGLNAGTVTASYTVPTSYVSNVNGTSGVVSVAGLGLTTTTTTGSNITGTLSTNGLSLAIPLYLTNVAGGSSWTVSDSATSGTVGRLAFTNLNGVTLSLSTGAAGSHTIVGSHNGLTSQSNQAFSANGGSSAFQTLSFANTNGVTFSNSNGSVQVTHDLQYTSNTSAITANALNTSVSRVINVVAATDSAGAGTASLSGNVSFTNANGLTFYTSAGGAIAGSYTVPTAGAALTINLSGNTSGASTATGNPINLSGINITLSGANNSQIAISAPATSSLSSGNNISISSNGSTIGISALAVAMAAGAQTATSGTVIFSNANGVTFGLNAGTLTASAAGAPTAYVSSVNGSSGAISLNVGSSLSASTNGSSITFGLATDITTKLQSAGAYLTTAAQSSLSNLSIAVAATNNTGGGTATLATSISFTNANGMTFYTSAGNAIAASYSVPVVPTAYVSSVNGSSGAISLNVGSSLSASTNGSSITFGLATDITTKLQSAGAYLTTAAQSSLSNLSIAVAATNNTGGGTATLATSISFTNANGMTFYTSAGNAIAASYSVPTQSVQTQASGAIAGTGFTSTTTTGTAITASLGTNGLNMAIPAYLTAAGGGNFSAGVSNLGNTAGSTGVSGSRIVFVGTNNISLSQSTDANGATISINQTGGAGGGNAIAVASGAASTTAAAGTVLFPAANGFTFGFDAASSQITLTATLLTVSDGVLSTGLRRLAFSNSNGVSFGLSTNAQSVTLTASVANNGGVYAGVSNLNANTAGSTGTVSTGNVVFVGVNNISLSQSTGAAGSNATISIVGEPPVKSWAYPNPNILTFLSNHVNASASINVIQVPFDISGTRMEILMYQSLASSATANTYAQAWSIYMGIYSNDTAASRIYSLSSGSTQTTYSNASNTAGVTQILGSGVRPISCPVNFTMTEGQYAIVANWVTTASSIGTATTALGQTLSVVGNPIQSASMAITPEYDVATAATNNFSMPMGMLNVASTGIPASISYSQINMTGLSRLRANFHIALRG